MSSELKRALVEGLSQHGFVSPALWQCHLEKHSDKVIAYMQDWEFPANYRELDYLNIWLEQIAKSCNIGGPHAMPVRYSSLRVCVIVPQLEDVYRISLYGEGYSRPLLGSMVINVGSVMDIFVQKNSSNELKKY